MKHNPFYYVVCLEKYMDILLEKKTVDRKNVQTNK